MFKTKLPSIVLSTTLALSLSACVAPQKPLTPEEKQMQQQAMQAMIERMKAGTARMQSQQYAQPAAQAAPRNVITQQALAESIQAIPGSDSDVNFERARDGVKINGSMYLDPEGEVVRVGSNSLTGEFTYLINTGPNQFTIKYNKAGSNFEPVNLAYVERHNNGYKVETVTGKKMSGSVVVPTSRGFIVARNASAFNFDPLKGLNNFSATEGYHIAQFQNGDVSSTGYILLEKDVDLKKKGTATDLFKSFKQIGSDLGLTDYKSYEYLLANIETGDVVPLDIRTDGKQTAYMSGCERQNSYVNKCKHSESRESLYHQNGSRNRGHYYWKVFWFNTPQGAFAVAQEAGLKTVTITNLETAQKVVAFKRALGISGFSANQSPDGTIALRASVGFSNESIDDAVSFFKSKNTVAAN